MLMKRNLPLMITLLVMVLLFLLSACASPTQTAENSGLDPAILAVASPMAENLMVALKNNNFQAFRANYDDAMLKATTEDAFQSLRTQLESQLGAYQSMTPKQIQTGGGFINVFYTVNFEKGPVTMQLVLTEGEPHLISGLWFK
jgi:uncharacterized lipoprotein YajG